MDAFLYDIAPYPVGTDQWIDYQENSNAEFGKACQSFTGDLLGHVDTVSAARDLDVLRAALGDEKLNYLGYSYGTLLGGTYAELFPKKTGRLVFDGAVDPATTEFDVTKTQATGFESALRAFVADCLDRKPSARSAATWTPRCTPSAPCSTAWTPARCGPTTAGCSAARRCSAPSSFPSTAAATGPTSPTCSAR